MVSGGDNRTILKPRNDDRTYKQVVLSNGLQVLLVSDPDTDKAAAAMDIHVGSYSDPEGLQGLAHFLEHMLFYASVKYPKEGMYKKFLSEHGGYANAYTGHQHTNYHFDVNAGHLEEALDRFAQFFICPLLSPEATSREIHAVDSENSKNLLSDSWRLCQLQKHFSSKDHPYHKYETGNKITLHTRPNARGIDIREELLRFYNKQYSAGLMCLTVYGKEPVTKLENIVRKKFSQIKNNNIEAPRFPGQPCLPEHLKIMVKSFPVRDQNVLAVTWPVIPSIRQYKKGASQYVQHFLESEAQGSLIALLKKLGWANSLSASEDGTLDYAFFSIYMELTNAGQENVQEVLNFLFQYIKLLQQQGIVAWIFDEKRVMNSTWFNFKDKADPIEYVVGLSDSMQNYPVEDWLATDALFSDYDLSAISALAHQLQPQKVRIFCSSKAYEMEATDVEPWYGTPFSVEKIDDLVIKRWGESHVDARLHLPSPNIFLPTDFSIKVPEEEKGHPIVIRKSSFSKLWYKRGTEFKTPKAYVYLSFNCPESNNSPEATILTYIFTWLLADEMAEYAYYTGLAGLHYSVHASKDGLEVVVEGYHDKLMSLTEKLVEKIVNFQMKEDRFAFVKEKVVRNYANMRFMQPHGQAHYEINHILSHGAWHLTECLDVLPSIDAQAFTVFFPRLLSRMFVEALVGGNVTRSEATTLMQHVEETLSKGPLVSIRAPSFSQMPERRIMCLEAGTEWLYPTAGFNPDDENSAVGIFFQAERDCSRSNVLLELFTMTAKEQHFNQLRTVEQLGYFVDLYEKHYENIRGVQITIQSTIKDPTHLDQRTEAFFLMFERELQKMTDEDFKNHAAVLLDVKMEKYKNLWEESDFYWREINGGSLQFDRSDMEVQALKELKKEDLIAFFNQKIRCNGSERKKLSVHVFGNQHHRQLAIAKGEVTVPASYGNGVSNGHGTSNGHHLTSNGTAPVTTMADADSCKHLPTGQEVIEFPLKPDNLQHISSTLNGHSDQSGRTPIRIDNVQVFKRSQSFYCSPKVAL
ncbi:insulin-degrading enzyme-like 1, peroxisomal isoform X1 [Physcomitrium patens]|uniref:Insulin-degrading enzyme-like 1, peroxisomal n=1 Tax=Physcomitrium patens TaxID=3218 RepID=A0A2K1KIZ4_PHYPA|nr:insulin-degrading enzyme-like 1, peroxisomal [Physcomitrium patens]XP_024375008.1 insulin-degrading enzyme-like 1, peroxisomal [Physcomitrium patens]PNR53754.1 hypothetical protein PHYPA_007429 [Physcomitrium patens]|eukprot:XP_024375007.1 insulin-degrading enzyme-like 1, peroxisomal [Physcomitrella patens]